MQNEILHHLLSTIFRWLPIMYLSVHPLCWTNCKSLLFLQFGLSLLWFVGHSKLHGMDLWERLSSPNLTVASFPNHLLGRVILWILLNCAQNLFWLFVGDSCLPSVARSKTALREYGQNRKDLFSIHDFPLPTYSLAFQNLECRECLLVLASFMAGPGYGLWLWTHTPSLTPIIATFFPQQPWCSPPAS